jgi:hypothetical protein
MRNTDDPWETPQRPLGERVQPVQPREPEWKPKPGSPGVEVNSEGKVRTQLPLPKYPRWFP